MRLELRVHYGIDEIATAKRELKGPTNRWANIEGHGLVPAKGNNRVDA